MTDPVESSLLPQSVLLNLVLVLLHIFFYLIFGDWAQYILVVADFAALILMRCVSPFPGPASLFAAS